MKDIQTTCNYCSLSCNFNVTLDNEKIVNIEPTKDYPVNNGTGCIKGLSLHLQNSVYGQNKVPQINGKDATLTEAISYVGNKFQHIISKYGEGSIAGISTGQMTLEEMALVGHVMRNGLRAHLDGNTRLCMATSVVAHKQSFGFDAPGYTLQDAEQSDLIILIGANPVVSHPILWSKIRKNKQKKLIVIDPRVTETSKNADLHIKLDFKSDIFFFYCLANYLISNNLINDKFIRKSVNNFEDYANFCQSYTKEVFEEKTKLPYEVLEQLANEIVENKAVSLWWTMGINQSYDAVRTAQSIINISLLTGNIGRPGTGANSITGQSNAMGSRLFSFQAGMFGGGDFDNPKRREKIANILNVEASYLIDKPTLPYNVIIEKIIAGEIKALWVMCTNPRHSWINNESFQQAIEKLELFVVSDIFSDTDTSKQADVFFPVVSGLKKTGTLINTERRLSRVNPIIPINKDEFTDFDVFYQLGTYLNMPQIDLWNTPEKVFNLMKACTENMPCDINGVNFNDLDGSKGIQWPFAKDSVLYNDNRRLFEDGKFFTPSGKANLIFEDPLENPTPISDKFPFVMNTGRGTVGQWHTGVRTREIKAVNDVVPPDAYILMSTVDGNRLNITHNEIVLVSSLNGNSAQFKVQLTNDMAEGEIFSPIHYIETNSLTLSIYDRYSKEPSYKYTPVNITKLES